MASSYENAGQGAREMAQCIRVLATQVFGPEFESQHPCKRVGMAACDFVSAALGARERQSLGAPCAWPASLTRTAGFHSVTDLSRE